MTRQIETREQRQAALNARVAKLRAKAAVIQSRADAILSTRINDYAYWTQPAMMGTASGRRFAKQRQAHTDKMMKGHGLANEAQQLRDRADSMERHGVTMAGDAMAARDAKVAACSVQVGQMVDTTHYGVREVIKVNRKTVAVKSGHPAGLLVPKEFIRPVHAAA